MTNKIKDYEIKDIFLSEGGVLYCQLYEISTNSIRISATLEYVSEWLKAKVEDNLESFYVALRQKLESE